MQNSFELIFSTGCYLGSSVATPRGPSRLSSTTSRAFHACSGLNISGACNKHRPIANQSKYGPFLLWIKFPAPSPPPSPHEPRIYLLLQVGERHEENPTLWLAIRASRMRLSCALRLTGFGPERKTYFEHYNKTVIDQACLVGMAGYLSRSSLRFYEPRIRFGP